MLIPRVLTALVLLPALLATLFWAPAGVFAAVFGAVGVLAAWEWAALLKGGAAPAFRFGLAAAVGLLFFALVVLPVPGAGIAALLGLASVYWLVVPWVLKGYPARLDALRGRAPGAAQLVLVVLATLVAAVHLRAQADGALKLLFILFLVFAADIGAYLAGRNLGRRKLAPVISPGKTVEGALGGVVLALLWALVGGVWAFGLHEARTLAAFLLLCAVVAVFSVVGDLLESAFKRLAQVKDSGTLLPGHGGVLDRVDSVLAALPLFVFGLILLGLS